jgi:hypothetical protein
MCDALALARRRFGSFRRPFRLSLTQPLAVTTRLLAPP